MAVGAGTLLAIAGISALATGGGAAISGHYAGKAADEETARQEKLARDQMDLQQRQHRDTLRARKKEFDFSKIGAGVSNLANLSNLRQNVGSPTASQRLLG